MTNNTYPTEAEVVASLKKTGSQINLSAQAAKNILQQLPVTTIHAGRSITRERERSIISSIKIFMSTTAKISLIVLVLGLIGVFGYTQLGTNPSNYAVNNVSDQPTTPAESANKSSSVAAGSGNVDEAVSAILAGATSEDLAISGEEADVSFVDTDNQEVVDLGQFYDENDF